MSEPRYRVISGYHHDEFCERVNAAIEEGYEPLGGVAVSWDGDDDTYFTQALYKPSAPAEEFDRSKIRRLAGEFLNSEAHNE
jgi:hypothetical protein